MENSWALKPEYTEFQVPAALGDLICPSLTLSICKMGIHTTFLAPEKVLNIFNILLLPGNQHMLRTPASQGCMGRTR